ncbi:MAG: Uma2 family endonuclease [Spirochaetaceae bacterium]|nr:Uma2 family endonuclease [Spirochaetaceae bacterium]
MKEVLQEGYYTVEDYYKLPYLEEQRYELDEGLLLMSPSPTGGHQKLYSYLNVQLFNYFDNKGYIVIPDFDVQLFEDEDTIYRPDLLVLCDLSKYTEQCIVGAPDFIIEIGSPSTINNDLGKKKLNYERAGVKEYWVVRTPYLVYTYLLGSDGKYIETIHRNEIKIQSALFKGLELDFSRLQNL